jgi:hypothetical protein
MLRIVPKPGGGHPRIHIDGAPAKAWIEHRPWRHGSTDWQLWYERQGRLGRGKCQLRLEIESRLRAWLLRHHRMPLATLSFEELRLIAEGKGGEARRAHAGGFDPLPRRTDSNLVPHASVAGAGSTFARRHT